MKRYIKAVNPKDITKEGLYYCKINGKIELCYYWKECDSLEIINPA